MSPIALFDTIHESHCTISTNFYLYLQYFRQKNFIFSNISGSQTYAKGKLNKIGEAVIEGCTTILQVLQSWFSSHTHTHTQKHCSSSSVDRIPFSHTSSYDN